MSVLAGIAAGAQALGAAGQLGLGIADYGQQKKAYKWQKKAQRKTWRREDNAVQRRAADLEKAGLSKTLAAGSGASASGPIKPDAPQHSKTTTPRAMEAFAAITRKALDVAKTQAEKDRVKQETEKSAAQTASITGFEQRAQELHGYKLTSEAQRITGQEIDNAIRRQRRVMSAFGIRNAYVQQQVQNLYHAWQEDPNQKYVVRVPLIDEKGQTRAVEKHTVDLSSVRYPQQLEMMFNQVALDANENALKLSGKEVAWYDWKSLSQMIFGGANTFSKFMPYMGSSQPNYSSSDVDRAIDRYHGFQPR